MKKVDLILKKAELFERLSVYGDRKSFLAALAQASYTPLVGYTSEQDIPDYEMTIGDPTVSSKPSQGDPLFAKYYTLAQNAKNLVDRIALMHEVSDKQNLALLDGSFKNIIGKVNDAINYLNTVGTSEAKSLVSKLQAVKSKASLPDIANKTEKALLEVNKSKKENPVGEVKLP